MVPYLPVRLIIYSLLILTPLARAAVQPWAVTVIHILTLAALSLFLCEKVIRWDRDWISTPMDLPIMTLILLAAVSTIFSKDRLTSIWAMCLLINYIVLFYLVLHVIRSRAEFRRLSYLILSIGLFLSVYGVLKLFGNNPFPWWEYEDLPQYVHRMTATYGNPNHLAGYMEMAIPLSLGLLLTGLSSVKRHVVQLATMILFVPLIFSHARGGWIGLAAGLSAMAFFLIINQQVDKKRLAIKCGALSIATFLIILYYAPTVDRLLSFQKDEDLIKNRIDAWSATLPMIRDHLPFGIGPGNYSLIFTQYQPPGPKRITMAHNDYLQFTAELGIAFPIIALWLIFIIYQKGQKKLKHPAAWFAG
jgi:O-antigen ligase